MAIGSFSLGLKFKKMEKAWLRLLCIVFIGSWNLLANCQTLREHYIIAFDLSIPLYKTFYLSPSIISKIDNILEENNFREGEDYVSVVGYSMEHKPSIERFVRPFMDIKGSPILWQQYFLSKNMSNWPNGQPIIDVEGGAPSSLQSLAKPYVIMETEANGDSAHQVDRTKLLLVTDEVVNGTDDDYRQEWNRVKIIGGNEIPNYNRIENDVFNTMRKFNEEYKFVQEPIKYAGKLRERIPLSPDGSYKIIPYEVVTAEKPSIHAVTDMPSPLSINRVRGGFRVNADVKSINPKYTIKDITIFDEKENVLGQTTDGSFDFIIPSRNISEGDTISVAMSLLLRDGFYDASILSYKNDRFKSGMTHKQVVKLHDEAKVMGIFPLFDIFWWWFPNNVLYAVLLWDAFIVLVFVVLIMYLIKRFSAYLPASDKISFSPVKTSIKYNK